jgi:hypothetical protein
MPHTILKNTKYQNKHGIFTDAIKGLYSLRNNTNGALASYNTLTNEVMALIQIAENEGSTLRALGAGWSWLQIMTGGPNGIMLDTKALNTIFEIAATRLATSYAGTAQYLRFVQCGAAIWEINNALKLKNLSLKTTGASNGQTIAGLIGTGAHGSAIDVGAAQDFVVGLHIILGSNKHVYLQRASRPVVNASFAAAIGASLVENDALFHAALVSFGSFGFIHGVMVETEDLFLLNASMRKQNHDADLMQLMQSLDFASATCPGLARPHTRPYHFEVKINPYDTDQQAFVTTMYKEPYHTNYSQPQPNAEGLGPGDDAPAFIGKVLEKVPSLIPKAINALTESSLTLFEKEQGTIGQIFNNTALRGKLLSAAVGLQPADIQNVIDILLDENKSSKHGCFPGIFAFRYIKGTEATLGFNRFATTCIMEMDGAYSSRSLAYCHAIWDRLQAENIAFTCHWGKQTSLNPGRIAYMYGQAAVDSWKTARLSLLSTAAVPVFTNPITQAWGLAD